MKCCVFLLNCMYWITKSILAISLLVFLSMFLTSRFVLWSSMTQLWFFALIKWNHLMAEFLTCTCIYLYIKSFFKDFRLLIMVWLLVTGRNVDCLFYYRCVLTLGLGMGWKCTPNSNPVSIEEHFLWKKGFQLTLTFLLCLDTRMIIQYCCNTDYVIFKTYISVQIKEKKITLVAVLFLLHCHSW